MSASARRLVLLGGPPGAGKTSVVDLLRERFPKWVIVDADDVWPPTKDGAGAIPAVVTAMRAHFEAGCELAVLSWVFARAELYQPVLDRLADVVDRALLLHLVADEETLTRRLVARGNPGAVAFAKSRLALVRALPFQKIDTSDVAPAEAADRVAAAILAWL